MGKRVLVVATSRKTRGGITAVLRLYKQSNVWKHYHCKWIETHRDGSKWRKAWYAIRAMMLYIVLLPFYDIVHIHFSLPPSAYRKYTFFKLAKLMGKRTVIHLHCGSQIDDIWGTVYQKIFEQCDCGIVLSEGLKAKIKEHTGTTAKIRVIYNPCPIITNTATYEKKNYILFSATLNKGKGYKDLIRAFSKVAAAHKDWSLVLAGNGEVQQARELSAQLGISEQVQLLGWVGGENKDKAFKEASVFCLPSYAEGFPMAVLDAWAYGLPVITTPVGGIPDVAIDGENMLLFNSGDIDILAEKLDLIMNDEVLRDKLSASSVKMAAENFNLDTITAQIAEIYESLANNRLV